MQYEDRWEDKNFYLLESPEGLNREPRKSYEWWSGTLWSPSKRFMVLVAVYLDGAAL